MTIQSSAGFTRRNAMAATGLGAVALAGLVRGASADSHTTTAAEKQTLLRSPAS